MGEASKRRLRSIGYAALLLTTGTVLGPVAVAAIASASPEKGEFGEPGEATMLVEAYRSRLETHRLMLTVESTPDGQECGYKTKDLFPGDYWAVSIRDPTYSPFEGYYILRFVTGLASTHHYYERLSIWIDDNVPQYEVAFLRRCIESTIFAGYCHDRVTAFAEAVAKGKVADYARGDAAHRAEILCTFVDGVAARNGLKLSPLNARKPKWYWGDESKE